MTLTAFSLLFEEQYVEACKVIDDVLRICSYVLCYLYEIARITSTMCLHLDICFHSIGSIILWSLLNHLIFLTVVIMSIYHIRFSVTGLSYSGQYC